jgi:hypothetical protein
MLTRSRARVFKPNPRYALATEDPATSPISPVPTSALAALKDPKWKAAMAHEFEALQKNQTWRLVDRPPGAHVIPGKWVFKHKLNPDGSLKRYKAQWVVRGVTQRAGVDFDETFMLVVKPAMIETVLTIAVSRRWSTKQLDVSNVFSHGHLKEHVLCQQPTSFFLREIGGV